MKIRRKKTRPILKHKKMPLFLLGYYYAATDFMWMNIIEASTLNEAKRIAKRLLHRSHFQGQPEFPAKFFALQEIKGDPIGHIIKEMQRKFIDEMFPKLSGWSQEQYEKNTKRILNSRGKPNDSYV